MDGGVTTTLAKDLPMTALSPSRNEDKTGGVRSEERSEEEVKQEAKIKHKAAHSICSHEKKKKKPQITSKTWYTPCQDSNPSCN
jgi:hypothetical protein